MFSCRSRHDKEFLQGPRNEGRSDDEDSVSPCSVTDGQKLTSRPRQLPLWVKRRVAPEPTPSPVNAKRACKRPDSPIDEFVLREKHPLNRGRPSHLCTGIPNKLYSPSDLITPIIDSMNFTYYRMGWRHVASSFGPVPVSVPALRRCENSVDDRLAQMGLVPQPATPQLPSCQGCGSKNRNDFIPTADKSHMVCKCGVVSAPIHISQEREKNCAADEDKTTHADKPYEPKLDRFDLPAKSCEQLRKEREREAAGTRVSKKAKQKHGLGWAHEHTTRATARADRQRQDMEPRDQTKSNHIQLELDKLFTPLEPLNANLKRFCRMEADRAWREAVRHAKTCQATGRCQLRIKEKGPTVIADAALACSINNLLEGKHTIDGVTHSGLLVVANKLGAQQAHKGTSCALRAVRTIVGALLAHSSPDPIPSCPLTTSCKSLCQSSPTPSSSSEASSARPAPMLASISRAPFQRADSSVSDMGEAAGHLIQLRDSVVSVFRALGTSMPNSVRESTLRVIQDPEFRAALDVAQSENENIRKLPTQGLAYILLEAVAQQLDRGTPGRGRRGVSSILIASFAVSLACLDAAISSVRALLPANLVAATVAEDGDGLFS